MKVLSFVYFAVLSRCWNSLVNLSLIFRPLRNEQHGVNNIFTLRSLASRDVNAKPTPIYLFIFVPTKIDLTSLRPKMMFTPTTTTRYSARNALSILGGLTVTKKYSRPNATSNLPDSDIGTVVEFTFRHYNIIMLMMTLSDRSKVSYPLNINSRRNE